MMTTAKIEQNIEESSSSGGSFVQSMNLLSTAKSSSNDSRDTSDISAQLSRRDETSEVSEDSDHENTKEGVLAETESKSDTKDLSKEGELPPPNASSTNQAVTGAHAQGSTLLSGMELASNEAAASAPSNVSSESVEALAVIAVEAGVKSAFTTEEADRQLSTDANTMNSHVEPATAGSTYPTNAKASVYARQLSGGSSDQSVEHTVESSSSGNSSRSDNASYLQTAALQTVRATGVEPKAPVGHIHLKEVSLHDTNSRDLTCHATYATALTFSCAAFLLLQSNLASNSLPKYHLAPAPIGSMAPVPIMSPPNPTKSKSSSSLRRGKWTVEEEAYVARVIQDFNSGFLNAPAGTTLRSYLSEKLHCDPMRITKKFTGDACIGKRVFHPAVRCASNAAAIDKAQVLAFRFLANLLIASLAHIKTS